MESFEKIITGIADFVCGYPLFFLLIGGGIYLFIASGAVSLRRLPESVRCLRQKGTSAKGEISSLQALLSAVAGTVGLGSIAGVAIALVAGGPGAIFWMWVSAVVGMCTKYHEGVLSIMYRGRTADGSPKGGMMYIIEKGLGPKWKPVARLFAVAGLFGTLCIINANQLTEAVVTMAHPGSEGNMLLRLTVGLLMALIVGAVVLRGVRSIAHAATVLVPVMVGIYFLMVAYIILTNLHEVPRVVQSIFTEAFSLRAGFGAFAGIAIIGARRAALVNDAGIGTASIMHGTSRNRRPVREGLVAMLGPSLDSGLVCTLTAMALLICVDFTQMPAGLKGLEIALGAFGRAIPMGDYLLMFIVVCFALSSMFSYSYYGTSCAEYLFGAKRARRYTYLYIASLAVFAVVPLSVAVGFCDLFYALMAIPSMCTILALSGRVRRATREYFQAEVSTDNSNNTEKSNTPNG